MSIYTGFLFDPYLRHIVSDTQLQCSKHCDLWQLWQAFSFYPAAGECVDNLVQNLSTPLRLGWTLFAVSRHLKEVLLFQLILNTCMSA